MARVPYAATVLPIILLLAGCSGPDRVPPTGPGPAQPPGETTTPPAPPVPAPQPTPTTTGTINLLRVSPDAGASLVVGTCRVGSVTRECAADWKGTFDVTVDRDVRDPVLTVSFFQGETRCGYAAASLTSVAAGVPTTFVPSTIFLTDEWGTPTPRCEFPARPTRLVAEFWTDADGTVGLKQEFALAYTFIRP